MTDASADRYQLSLQLHRELEALYPRIEQYGARFRDPAPIDPRIPRPPGRTPGFAIDPVVCALSIKAATTKRAVLALCELGDGDNAIALARILLENACLLEWLIRGEGRRRLESYVLFQSVVHERIAETIKRHREHLINAGANVDVRSDPYHNAIWTHTFSNAKGRQVHTDRPTWNFDDPSGVGELVKVRAMFREIAGGGESFEYDMLYGALGSDVVHSGPFCLARIRRDLKSRQTFTLSARPDRELVVIALAVSNTAMFLVLESLAEYMGLDLSAELAPMKKRADPPGA